MWRAGEIVELRTESGLKFSSPAHTAGLGVRVHVGEMLGQRETGAAVHCGASAVPPRSVPVVYGPRPDASRHAHQNSS